ncbi:hypothetical protein EC2845650_0833 [Escherichia coli 2845650]|nr:hypothetical protein EC2845650_0833 [Escherichia coli 2845650]EZK24866.1 hypothetical protein AB26_0901 [Escherichia coli 2-011-08_S1_C2]
MAGSWRDKTLLRFYSLVSVSCHERSCACLAQAFTVQVMDAY